MRPVLRPEDWRIAAAMLFDTQVDSDDRDGRIEKMFAALNTANDDDPDEALVHLAKSQSARSEEEAPEGYGAIRRARIEECAKSAVTTFTYENIKGEHDYDAGQFGATRPGWARVFPSFGHCDEYAEAMALALQRSRLSHINEPIVSRGIVLEDGDEMRAAKAVRAFCRAVAYGSDEYGEAAGDALGVEDGEPAPWQLVAIRRVVETMGKSFVSKNPKNECNAPLPRRFPGR